MTHALTRAAPREALRSPMLLSILDETYTRAINGYSDTRTQSFRPRRLFAHPGARVRAVRGSCSSVRNCRTDGNAFACPGRDGERHSRAIRGCARPQPRPPFRKRHHARHLDRAHHPEEPGAVDCIYLYRGHYRSTAHGAGGSQAAVRDNRVSQSGGEKPRKRECSTDRDGQRTRVTGFVSARAAAIRAEQSLLRATADSRQATAVGQVTAHEAGPSWIARGLRSHVPSNCGSVQSRVELPIRRPPFQTR